MSNHLFSVGRTTQQSQQVDTSRLRNQLLQEQVQQQPGTRQRQNRLLDVQIGTAEQSQDETTFKRENQENAELAERDATTLETIRRLPPEQQQAAYEQLSSQLDPGVQQQMGGQWNDVQASELINQARDFSEFVKGGKLGKLVRGVSQPGGQEQFFQQDPQSRELVPVKGALPAPKSPLVNVDLRKEDPFTAAVSKAFGKEFVKERADAMDAVKLLESSKESVKLLNAGIISGKGAHLILGIGKVLKRIGLFEGEVLANTEAYLANQATQVASIIKAFGAGTGLSDADREYAEKASAGDITMLEEALRKIIDINAEAAFRKIKRFNDQAERVNEGGKIPFDLKVPVPEPQSAVKKTSNIEDLVNKYAD